jgi:hypothetical protein
MAQKMEILQEERFCYAKMVAFCGKTAYNMPNMTAK